MTEDRLYRFPPFPDPPTGVLVVPFAEFVPEGYRSVTGPCGDPIEVDARMGVRTVKVLNEQEAAHKRKAKKRQRNAGNAVDAAGRLIPWWEEWEDGEDLRATSESFDRVQSLQDRVCIAADDFRLGRTWPEIAQGVRNMWDQFRLYIGLISSIPVYKKVKNRRRGQVDGPDNAAEASDEEEDVPRAKQMSVVVQDYLEQTALPGKQLEPGPDESTIEAQRLRAFVDDMEKSVRVFLSSYMRDKGLIWAEKNLSIMPTLLHFFLRFMLRNGVFADAEDHLANLERAITLAAAARKELPLTAKLGQILPGRFDLACKECWGTKGSTSVQILATFDADVAPSTSPSASPSPNDAHAAFESELERQVVEVVPSHVVLDSVTARRFMHDLAGGGADVGEGAGVGAGADPWAAAEAIREREYTTTSWTDVSIPWMIPLLGPTTLPLTMRTGVVECSTRRVREVRPPAHASVSGARTPVEAALGETFFGVAMTPWVLSPDDATPDFPGPEVSGDVGGWDPYRDDLTILVDAETAEHLVPGMGLCGTWVQMVPEEGGAERPGSRWWYVENLAASFPSYYTEGETIGVVDEEDEDL